MTNIYFLNFLHLSTPFFFSMIVFDLCSINTYAHFHIFLSSPTKSQWCSMHTTCTHSPRSSPTATNTSLRARRRRTCPRRSSTQRQVRHISWKLLFFVICATDTEACVGSTCRYPSHTSPIGALSLLPSVSWSGGVHCSPPGLVHATVSSTFHHAFKAGCCGNASPIVVYHEKKKRI